MVFGKYEDSQRELRQHGLLKQANHQQVIYFGQLDQVSRSPARRTANASQGSESSGSQPGDSRKRCSLLELRPAFRTRRDGPRA